MRKRGKIALIVSLLIILAPILAYSVYRGYREVQAMRMTVAYGKSLTFLGAAMQVYVHSTGKLPHNVGRLSWRVELLRVDGDPSDLALYRQFRLDEPWDSPHNKKLIEKIPWWFQDPEGKQGYACYKGISGKDCAFDDGKTIAPAPGGGVMPVAIVMTKESCPWTKPADVPVEEVEKGACLRWFKDGTSTRALDSEDGQTNAIGHTGGTTGWRKLNPPTKPGFIRFSECRPPAR